MRQAPLVTTKTIRLLTSIKKGVISESAQSKMTKLSMGTQMSKKFKKKLTISAFSTLMEGDILDLT